ncbi:hypothetical protein NEF87_004978 [Candidatus Lokiarchaeum ossiferum]|uniref:Leucine-rich repeat domain-containing protein n=1 Tax=Candidatus Lokiarchaeum ossiferum TaxID=2951803 RepID=A0ABY6HZ62_9ARCH|nr:hypothetical protein NEF87_004978 [Candidatus Lokiarchaeum sp. B-35]
MELVEMDTELVQEFISLFENANNINISTIIQNLGISRSELFDSLVSWSDYFDFSIEDDRVYVKNLSSLIQAKENVLNNSVKNALPIHEIFEGALLYQNVPLYSKETQFLQILEQLIQTPILESSQNNFLNGFYAEGGHILKLGLNHQFLSQLPESISDLQYLTELKLDNLQLKFLPDSLVHLSHLTHLSLTNNFLRSLPKNFGDLTQLSSLLLDDNNLESLPYSLIHCSSLKNLSITRNNINLKESFEILRKLKQDGCLIDQKQAFRWSEVGYEGIICNSGLKQDDFVNTIFHLDSMLSFEELCAQMVLVEKEDKRFVKPDDFDRWDIKERSIVKNMVDPDEDYSWALFYNDIPLVKDEYDIMKYLEELLGLPIPPVSSVEMKFGFIAEEGHVVELGLYYLNLITVPEAIVLLTSLRHLFLGNNRFSSIPYWIGCLTSLEILNFQQNHIFSIPDLFSSLTKLTKLDLSHNRILSLPKSMEKLTNLRYLNIEDNQLNLTKSKEALQKIKHNGCSIDSIKAFRMREIRK